MAASSFCISKCLGILIRFAKNKKIFFLEKYHIFEIILHINDRAYEQDVGDINGEREIPGR